MGESQNNSLYLTYFPYGIAMGILSTLIPLYLVEELKGSLIDLGTMTFVATASLIPASVYLGRLPDRYRRLRGFILSSFLGVALVLLLMPFVTDVLLFQILYVLMNLVAYLKGPSTSVLIAESFESGRRGLVLAKQSFVESMGGATGLAVCSLTISFLGYRAFLEVTGPLVLASFILAFITIHDPPLYIERFLERLGRWIDNVETFSLYLTDRGTLAPNWQEALRVGREPNMILFGLGITLFAFAASNAFTALPIYLLVRAGLTSSTIFASFLIRSIFGAISYIISGRLVGSKGGRMVKVSTGIRVISVILLPIAALLPFPLSAVAVAALLSIIAFSWSLYSIGVDVVTLAYASPGSLGLYDAVSGIGGALGCLTGGLIPALYGFDVLFSISSGVFASALLLFMIGLK